MSRHRAPSGRHSRGRSTSAPAPAAPRHGAGADHGQHQQPLPPQDSWVERRADPGYAPPLPHDPSGPPSGSVLDRPEQQRAEHRQPDYPPQPSNPLYSRLSPPEYDAPRVRDPLTPTVTPTWEAPPPRSPEAAADVTAPIPVYVEPAAYSAPAPGLESAPTHRAVRRRSAFGRRSAPEPVIAPEPAHLPEPASPDAEPAAEAAPGRRLADRLTFLRQRVAAGAPAPGMRRAMRIALFTGVILALVGGPAAFAALDKDIQVTLDGRPTAVTTYASTVGGVLDGAGVDVDDRDSITPGLTERVHDGDEIVVNRARLLQLTVDGSDKEIWVTANSVDEALAQLGYSDPATWVSASRSERLPLTGAQLAIRTPKTVAVTVDGTTQQVRSSALTVDELLADAGIDIESTDTLSVPGETAVTEGLAVTVTRVRGDEVIEQQPLPFQKVEQPDPASYSGIKSTIQTGVDGVQEVTYRVTLVDGVETGREQVGTRVITPAVDEITSVGSKAFPSDVESLNWNALAKCESTNNPGAISASGTYHGLYQFSAATWSTVGGSGLPSQASPEEQTARAKMLYMRSGAGQWACGSHLFD